MQNVIVASDLSERSRPAVKRAVELAIEANAKLTVLNVVNDALPTDISHQVKVGAATILKEQVATDIGTRKLDTEIKVVGGDPIAVINEAALELQADLLVVGSHRRRRFLDQIRETTMEHLIRASQIPVLLVTKQVDQPYQSVICGIALSGVCASIFPSIVLVAPRSELTLFHAHDVSFRKEAELEYDTWTTVYPVPSNLPEPIYVEAKAQEALQDLLRTQAYDLLAVGGHTRADGGRFVIGSFTAGLIRKPPCDILIGK